MPELAELRLAANMINETCRGVLFRGPLFRSAVSRSASINLHPLFRSGYNIEAISRGKELALVLSRQLESRGMGRGKRGSKRGGSKASKTSLSDDAAAEEEPVPSDPSQPLHIVFRFGMSGKFQWAPNQQALDKHAHLQFTAADARILSFVDARRFGGWAVGGFNTASRGPDPTTEHEAFRDNLNRLLAKSPKLFERPICELLMEQRAFNGIGNYLRAEILHRAKVQPFVRAREHIERCLELPPAPNGTGRYRPGDASDLLSLCKKVPDEVLISFFVFLHHLNTRIICLYDSKRQFEQVLAMKSSGYMFGGGQPKVDGKEAGEVKEVREKEMARFVDWLQCYQKAPNNLVDHQKRT